MSNSIPSHSDTERYPLLERNFPPVEVTPPVFRPVLVRHVDGQGNPKTICVNAQQIMVIERHPTYTVHLMDGNAVRHPSYTIRLANGYSVPNVYSTQPDILNWGE